MKTKYRVIIYFMIYLIVVYGGLALWLKSPFAKQLVKNWAIQQAQSRGVQLAIGDLSLSLLDISVTVDEIAVRDPSHGISFTLSSMEASLRPLYLLSGILGFDRVHLSTGQLVYQVPEEKVKGPRKSVTPMSVLASILGGVKTLESVRYENLRIEQIEILTRADDFQGTCKVDEIRGRRSFRSSLQFDVLIGPCPFERPGAPHWEKENQLQNLSAQILLDDQSVTVKELKAVTNHWKLKATGSVSVKDEIQSQIDLEPVEADQLLAISDRIAVSHPRFQMQVTGTIAKPVLQLDASTKKVELDQRHVFDSTSVTASWDQQNFRISKGMFYRDSWWLQIEDGVYTQSNFKGRLRSNGADIQTLFASLLGDPVSYIHGSLLLESQIEGKIKSGKLDSLQTAGEVKLLPFQVVYPKATRPSDAGHVIALNEGTVPFVCKWEQGVFECNELLVNANGVEIKSKLRVTQGKVDIDFNSLDLDVQKITKRIRRLVIKGKGPASGHIEIHPGEANFVSVSAQTTLKDVEIDDIKLGEVTSRVTYNYDADVLAFTEATVKAPLSEATGEFGLRFDDNENHLWGKAQIGKATGEVLTRWGMGRLSERIQFKAGTWKGNIDFAGPATLGKFKSTLRLDGKQAEWFGILFDSISIGLDGDSSGVRLSTLRFVRSNWTMQGGVHIDPKSQIFGTLKSSGVELGDLVMPFPRPTVIRGQGDLSVDLSGSVLSPTVDVDFQGLKVVSNSYPIGEVNYSFRYQGDGKTIYNVRSGKDNEASFEFSKSNFRASFRAKRLNVFPFMQWYVPLKTVEGNALILSGQGTLSGQWNPWKMETVSLDVKDLQMRSRTAEIGVEPFLLKQNKEGMSFNSKVEGTKSDGRLSLNLNEEGTGEIRVQGKLALQWMTDWVSNIDWSNGQLDGGILVSLRRWSLADITGSTQILSSEVDFEFLKDRISDISGQLVFSKNQMAFENILGRIGGGSVRIVGNMTYPWIEKSSLDLEMDMDKVRLRPYQDVFIELRGKTRMSGSKRPYAFRGDLVVENAQISGDRFSKSVLVREIESRFIPEEFQSGGREFVTMDLGLSIPRVFRVISPQFTGDLRGQVRVSGTDARPVLLGNVQILNGDLDIRGNAFKVETGTLRFEDPNRNDPLVNVSASSDFVQTVTVDESRREEKYRIFLNISGKWSFPKLEYSSDPPLSEDDIVSLVVFGVTAQQFGKQEGQAVLQKELVPQLFARSRVSRDIEKSTGFRVRLSPDYSDSSKEGTLPRVAVSRKLGEKVDVEFKSNIDSESYREFNVQYRFNDNVSLKGLWEGRGEDESVSGQSTSDSARNRNSFGGDIRYRIEFK